VRFGPTEQLRDTVDLIVIPGVRKAEDLVQEGAEPRRVFRQENLAGLKARALGFHAHMLVAFGLDPDWYRNVCLRVCSEFLHEMETGPGLLDQKRIGRIFAGKTDARLVHDVVLFIMRGRFLWSEAIDNWASRCPNNLSLSELFNSPSCRRPSATMSESRGKCCARDRGTSIIAGGASPRPAEDRLRELYLQPPPSTAWLQRDGDGSEDA
jgi:hypothetical protein